MSQYHSDPVLSWLASQFHEGLASPNQFAKTAFGEILKLRELKARNPTPERIMSIEDIARTQEIENLKFEAAKAIRSLLSDYSQKHALLCGDDWETVETEISELVFGE